MTAGQIAEHFDCAKPTLSAHFAVLREADLVEPDKVGTTITYSLKVSVLEDALLGFAGLFGLKAAPAKTSRSARRRARMAPTPWDVD